MEGKPQGSPQQQQPPQQKTRGGVSIPDVLEGADEYLASHNIPSLLKEALSDILEARPENPERYLLAFFASAAKASGKAALSRNEDGPGGGGAEERDGREGGISRGGTWGLRRDSFPFHQHQHQTGALDASEGLGAGGPGRALACRYHAVETLLSRPVESPCFDDALFEAFRWLVLGTLKEGNADLALSNHRGLQSSGRQKRGKSKGMMAALAAAAAAGGVEGPLASGGGGEGLHAGALAGSGGVGFSGGPSLPFGAPANVSLAGWPYGRGPSSELFPPSSVLPHSGRETGGGGAGSDAEGRRGLRGPSVGMGAPEDALGQGASLCVVESFLREAGGPLAADFVEGVVRSLRKVVTGTGGNGKNGTGDGCQLKEQGDVCGDRERNGDTAVRWARFRQAATAVRLYRGVASRGFALFESCLRDIRGREGTRREENEHERGTGTGGKHRTVSQTEGASASGVSGSFTDANGRFSRSSDSEIPLNSLLDALERRNTEEPGVLPPLSVLRECLMVLTVSAKRRQPQQQGGTSTGFIVQTDSSSPTGAQVRTGAPGPLVGSGGGPSVGVAEDGEAPVSVQTFLRALLGASRAAGERWLRGPAVSSEGMRTQNVVTDIHN
uniref:Uncharacterized protein n=1 Tax=Chromera velia CCMP2878 TaxID=1169474 RepID=A0A0G4IBC2_9ALVE|eukprot:Cvel_12781.t1-p1 / transcript=Cvel_12781.t1 / gene=Cvel_12781 / organism=Chromera_velia_CCMP2878 / gene_product=hypothetical protein / transcript_product=hypothetical protein / location=Cvel_scaffold850:41233-47346(+) / protein_length=613 / sequence_SO=supercontig / SO=protein_coding / is_pseudo=false